ncbi:hypothetical protein MP228_004675 [Amoeboaphelidium protococcarum]|nr:hypothetical protein MP228_004675 [Amoeboaphelidium protococcarum]
MSGSVSLSSKLQQLNSECKTRTEYADKSTVILDQASAEEYLAWLEIELQSTTQNDKNLLLCLNLLFQGSQGAQETCLKRKVDLFQACFKWLITGTAVQWEANAQGVISRIQLEIGGLPIQSLKESCEQLLPCCRPDGNCSLHIFQLLPLLLQAIVNHKDFTTSQESSIQQQGLIYREIFLGKLLSQDLRAEVILKVVISLREVHLSDSVLKLIARKSSLFFKQVPEDTIPQLYYNLHLLCKQQYALDLVMNLSKYISELLVDVKSQDGSISFQFCDNIAILLHHIGYAFVQNKSLSDHYVKKLKELEPAEIGLFHLVVLASMTKSYQLQSIAIGAFKYLLQQFFVVSSKQSRNAWLQSCPCLAQSDISKMLDLIIECAFCGWDDVLNGLILFSQSILEGGPALKCYETESYSDFKLAEKDALIVMAVDVQAKIFTKCDFLQKSIFEAVVDAVTTDNACSVNSIVLFCRLVKCNASALNKYHAAISSVMSVITSMPYQRAELLMYPLAQLCLSNENSLNGFMLILKKALFQSHPNGKMVALLGFVELLRVNVKVGSSNDISFEILEELEKCFNLPEEFKCMFYLKLISLFQECKDVKVNEYTVETLWGHLNQYIDNRPNGNRVVVDFNLAVQRNEVDRRYEEPIALLFKTIICGCIQLKSLGSASDAIQKVKDIMQQLLVRFNEIDVSLFGFDKQTDFNSGTVIGQKNLKQSGMIVDLLVLLVQQSLEGQMIDGKLFSAGLIKLVTQLLTLRGQKNSVIVHSLSINEIMTLISTMQSENQAGSASLIQMLVQSTLKLLKDPVSIFTLGELEFSIEWASKMISDIDSELIQIMLLQICVGLLQHCSLYNIVGLSSKLVVNLTAIVKFAVQQESPKIAKELGRLLSNLSSFKGVDSQFYGDLMPLLTEALKDGSLGDSVSVHFAIYMSCLSSLSTDVLKMATEYSEDVFGVLGNYTASGQTQGVSKNLSITQQTALAAALGLFQLYGDAADEVDWISQNALIHNDGQYFYTVLDHLSMIIDGLNKLIKTPLYEHSVVIYKTVIQLFKLFARIVKMVIDNHNKASQIQLNDNVIDFIRSVSQDLTPQIYGFMSYVSQIDMNKSRQDSEMGKAKKRKGKAKAGSTNAATLGADAKSKVIPNMIFAIEQYEKHLVRLSKLTKVDLMQYCKRSTTRDFRIKMDELEKFQSDGESTAAENDDNNDDDEENDLKKLKAN